MYTLTPFPLVLFPDIMSQIETGGGGAVQGDAGAGRDFAGRDRLSHGNNDVNIHFDRAANWDAEREELTDRQRIRDLETYVFGDRRGFTLGVIRQLRNHVVWLIILSLLQFVALVLLTILIGMLLQSGVGA